MNKPLVSIIVPAYNAEKFLRQAVGSALRQTYSNIEVIVVDDGSIDSTKAIAEELARGGRRVRVFSQKNAGQSAARNTGIREARGAYVAFLDADDLFLPEKIERQVRELEEHPDFGLSYCKIYHFFDEHPSELYYFSMPHPSGNIFEDLLRANFIAPLTVVVRKSALDEFGAFESTFRRVDEQYLWLKLSYRGVKFRYLDEPLGLYRVHEKSLSNEAVYFAETEAQFLKLISLMRNWMTEAEIEKYCLGRIERRARLRLIAGKIIAGKNPLSKFLLGVYFKRRQSRLKKVRHNHEKEKQ